MRSGLQRSRASASIQGARATFVPLSVSRPNVLVGGRDREFRRLIHRLLLFSGRLEAVREIIARQVGVTGVQYTMLMSVLHQDKGEGISIGALAEYLEVTGAHVTSQIGKLAAAGFVRKTVNPHDGRGILVQLTAHGRERLIAAHELIRGINNRLFEGVSPSEFKALRSFFGKYAKNTENALNWGKRYSSTRQIERARGKNGV